LSDTLRILEVSQLCGTQQESKWCVAVQQQRLG
jgi:hypothetical protein